MSAEPKYTERDLVMAKREAFREGSRWLSCWCSCNGAYDDYRWITGDSRGRPEEAAADRYKLPKVTRPRVVKESGGMAFRFVGNPSEQFACIEYMSSYEPREWKQAHGSDNHLAVTTERIRIWSDLLANPTEECEDA